MNSVLVKSFNCRPYSELRTIKTSEWTKDELTAFRKFNPDGNIDRFIREWEQICNKLNPTRKGMRYD
jgi:hypothetical protein